MKYICFLMVLFCLQSSAQTVKLFLDTNRNVISDSTKAEFYAIIEKLNGDSAWAAKIYNLRGDPLSVGTYKDNTLKVPHGKITYYDYDLHFNNDSSSFELYRYVHTIGYYLNGVRSGPWVRFHKDGPKNYVYVYENGKFNGVYERYNSKGEVIETGQYINDLKEGKWEAEVGTILTTSVYKNNKKISEKDDGPSRYRYLKNNIGHYGIVKGHPEYNFDKYLDQTIKPHVPYGVDGLMVVTFTLDRKGKIKNPKITRKLNEAFDKAIINAFLTSPNWIPSIQDYSGITQDVTCPIIVINSRVRTYFTQVELQKDPFTNN